ncbi:MAG: hypothetical protein AAGG72_09165 [Pseudomonadota bacterium]
MKSESDAGPRPRLTARFMALAERGIDRVGRLALQRSSWALVDQAIVSGGTFIGNILLARAFAPSEYGTFAILFGVLLGLQLFNATLLFHPISIQVINSPPQQTKVLLATSITLTAIATVLLGLVLSVGLIAFGLGHLVIPSCVWFFFWQIQEGLRRGLLSQFRHRDACVGDAISYIGQALAIIFLSVVGSLTLPNALWGMALTSGLAAALQWVQLAPRGFRRMPMRETVVDFWSVGGIWALGSGLLTHFRMSIAPWLLAFTGGPAAAAGFQAAINLINLLNPLTMSVGNLVPTAVSQVKEQGLVAAWRTAWSYGVLALPPILAYGLIVIAAPGSLLSLLYGAQSSYVGLTLPVQLLMVSMVISYLGEIAIYYVHGLAAIRKAFFINVIAAVFALLFAIVMIDLYGLTGGCAALLLANIFRLMIAYFAIRPMLRDEPARAPDEPSVESTN